MSIYEHDCFITPDKDAILWRYMDLNKFQSLLETKSLFFCRVDKFSDPFEGSLPKIEAEYRFEEHKRMDYEFDRKFNEELVIKNINGIGSLHQRLKKGTVVNCWHSNSNESDAMWQLYLKDNEGVAIQSSVDKIANVIRDIPEKIGISKVRYLNYETDRWYDRVKYPIHGYNLYIPLVHKRIEFEHEREVRLIYDVPDAVHDAEYWDRQPNGIGKFININIETLIEKIILPPTIDSKAAFKIEQLVKSYGYNFKFEKSVLSKKPWF